MKPSILTILFSTLLFFACSTDNEPVPTIIDPVGNTTIAEVYQMCLQEAITPKTDITICGTVTSSDSDGHINRYIYLDDSTGAARINTGLYNNSAIYPEGIKIAVNISGLSAQIEDNILTIGYSIKDGVITGLNADCVMLEHIRRGTSRNYLSPIRCTINDIGASLCGKLVTLEEMVHSPLHPREPLIGSGYHRFTDAKEQALYIYIDTLSIDRDSVLPKGKVTLTGIATLQKIEYENHEVVVILPRKHSDIWQ